MTPNFKLSSGSYSLWKFQSGELGIKLCTDSDLVTSNGNITITGSILSSDHVMELLQLKEALDYYTIGFRFDLIMPYCAYSRQDRRCNFGESLSLKLFAQLINSCNFTNVTTYDNHSDVSTALINNCTNIHVKNILDIDMFNGTSLNSIGPYYEVTSGYNKYDYLISPDSGSNKKVFDCSQYFNIPMIRADKVRDTSTGDIAATEVFATSEQLKDKTVLIVDDIVANGRTFTELAKAIKTIEPSCTVHLYATHGFFHKGLHTLRSAGISKFITTNSVYELTNPAIIATDLIIIRL